MNTASRTIVSVFVSVCGGCVFALAAALAIPEVLFMFPIVLFVGGTIGLVLSPAVVFAMALEECRPSFAWVCLPTLAERSVLAVPAGSSSPERKLGSIERLARHQVADRLLQHPGQIILDRRRPASGCRGVEAVGQGLIEAGGQQVFDQNLGDPRGGDRPLASPVVVIDPGQAEAVCGTGAVIVFDIDDIAPALGDIRLTLDVDVGHGCNLGRACR